VRPYLKNKKSEKKKKRKKEKERGLVEWLKWYSKALSLIPRTTTTNKKN
jgi:hypothetical protein